MRKIRQTVKKNFRVLLKNKFSLIILFLGPILIILLMGFFYFNSNLYNINLGVHAPDNSSNSNFIIGALKTSEFKITEFDSREECMENTKAGGVHGCIVFPENFTIQENKSNVVTVSLDTSRGDIIAITQNLLLVELGVQSEKLQISNTDKLISTIQNSEELANNNINNINKLREINTQVKGNNKKIGNYMLQIEALYDTDNFDIDNLEDRAKSVNTTIASFATTAGELLTNTEDYLDNLSDLLNDESLNNSAGIDDYVDDSIAAVASANRKVSTLKTDFNLRKLTEDLEDIKSSFDKAQGSLDTITGFVDEVVDGTGDSATSFVDVTSDIENESTTLLAQISELPILDSEALVRPVEVRVENIIPDSEVHLTSLFPSLLVSLIFIISLILASSFVLAERKSQASFRNFMSKNSAFNFIFADFFTLFLIVFTQIFSIILIYYLFFLQTVSVQIFYLALFTVPVIATFVLMGMIIGYLTNSETSNVIFSFLVIFVFLALSGQLLPIEVLTGFLLKLTFYNPFLVSEGLIRQYLLFSASMADLRFNLTLIVSYMFTLFVVAWIFESFTKKRFLYNMYTKVYLNIFDRTPATQPDHELDTPEDALREEEKIEKKQEMQAERKREGFFKTLLSGIKMPKFKRKHKKKIEEKEETTEQVDETKEENTESKETKSDDQKNDKEKSEEKPESKEREEHKEKPHREHHKKHKK